MKYLLATLSAIIGVLVLALKMQGSKLHKAQVLLLAQQIAAGEAADDVATKVAREKFKQAMVDYIKAGGK